MPPRLGCACASAGGWPTGSPHASDAPRASRSALPYPAESVGEVRSGPDARAGSSPEDRNADICQPRTGRVLSHNFADIATHLRTRGYAVMRYDKRGVTGPCRGSFRYTLPELLADAGRVLSAAERSPHVDAHRVSSMAGARARRWPPRSCSPTRRCPA